MDAGLVRIHSDEASQFGVNPRGMFSALGDHRELVVQLTKREIVGRYRGSIMGLFWSFANPLIMLAEYTTLQAVMRQRAS